MPNDGKCFMNNISQLTLRDHIYFNCSDREPFRLTQLEIDEEKNEETAELI